VLAIIIICSSRMNVVGIEHVVTALRIRTGTGYNSLPQLQQGAAVPSPPMLPMDATEEVAGTSTFHTVTHSRSTTSVVRRRKQRTATAYTIAQPAAAARTADTSRTQVNDAQPGRRIIVLASAHRPPVAAVNNVKVRG
jgi:hypothetical protein